MVQFLFLLLTAPALLLGTSKSPKRDFCADMLAVALNLKEQIAWGGFRSVQILPESLLTPAELEALGRVGPVTVETKESMIENALGPREAMEIKVLVGEQSILGIKFARETEHPEVWTVESLHACAPVASDVVKREYIQCGKGLSAGIFQSILRKLIALAHANGAEVLKTLGADNYLVSKMYQRQFGFRPVHPVGTRFFSVAEKLYAYCRQHDTHKQFNPTLFSHMLGLSNELHPSKPLLKLWKDFLKGGPRSNAYSFSSGEESLFLGILPNNLVTASWIDRSTNPARILRWRNLLDEGYLALELRW